MYKTISITSFFIVVAILLFSVGCSENDDSDNIAQSQNHAPVVQSVVASPNTVIETMYHDSANLTTLSCVATDQDGDVLNYSWSCPAGTFMEGIQFGSVVQMYFYRVTGTFIASVIVSDGFEVSEDSVQIEVLPY